MARKKRSIASPTEDLSPLPSQLWEIKQVAAFLQVGRTRVFQLMRERGLPYIKWDRTLRFHPNEIALWLKSQLA